MAPSMEEVLRQKDARIAKLECEKQRHVHELAQLRSVIGASQIKHNKDVYWLQLECDTVLRAKEAVEDRLAELLRGLRKMDGDEDEESVEERPVCLDGTYVLSLRTQLEKALQTVVILNNQISMVKSSYEDVIKSLKEEIGEVVEDKCRMEMDLMNQLVTLDDEKRQLEASWHNDDSKRSSDGNDSDESGPEESFYEDSETEDSNAEESFCDDAVCDASISDISDEEKTIRNDKEEKELQVLKQMVNLKLEQKKKLADANDENLDETVPLVERVNPIRTLLQINPNRNN